ncbi:MAG: hypothetical protein RKP20_17160 [Candidatus Competibacter sp.]|nr:hypothetical protein [Candidatus Competibacter sp.]
MKILLSMGVSFNTTSESFPYRVKHSRQFLSEGGDAMARVAGELGHGVPEDFHSPEVSKDTRFPPMWRRSRFGCEITPGWG